MPKPVETIKSRELLIITDTSSRNKPGAGYKMRVVQYYKDGKNISVKLESGEYWAGDDGVTRFKAKGLSPRDIKELLKVDATTKKRIIQIVEALQDNPPAIPTETDSGETQAAEDAGF